MASDNISRPSLFSQFDDLCRQNKVLITGCEKEFKHFLKVLLSTQQLEKLKQAEAKIDDLQQKIDLLETEKIGFEGQIKQLKIVIGEEETKVKKLESENKILAKKLACIQGILVRGNSIDAKTKKEVNILLSDAACAPRQPLLRHGIVDGSIEISIDCDDTFEQTSFDVSYQQKQPSGGNAQYFGNPLYSKQKEPEKAVTSQFTADHVPDLLKIDKVPEVERCLDVLSSSELNSSIGTSSSAHQLDYEKIESCSYYNLRNRNSRRDVSNASNFQLLSSTGLKFGQGHSFVSKSGIRSEKCYSCDKGFMLRKQALKCDSCKITCHQECKDKCPASCIPITPRSSKASENTISDFTPSTSPMIPSLIIHCVNEIESRGFKDISLYQISGEKKKVTEIKEKLLKGKKLIKLNNISIHVLCGAIKSFLRSLKEPLIPTSAWQSFVNTAELQDKNRSLHLLYNLVCDLPQPNRETLSFLIQHLQRVSESTDCQMPVENLAMALGPTIVGYSSPSFNSKRLKELPQQCSVMQKLLILPSICWHILDNDLSINPKEFPVVAAIKAFEARAAAMSGRNEPVYASVVKDLVKNRKDGCQKR